MKKHTRFLALIITFMAILSCFGGMAVLAEDEDLTNKGSSSAVCEIEDHGDWKELNQDNIASHMFLYDQHYYLTEGDYYLGENLEMGVTIYIYPGTTVNLCLNGHDITMTSDKRTILNPKANATLNLYDCGTDVRYYDENGWVEPLDGDDWDDASDEEKEAAVAAAEDAGTNPIEIVGGAIYGSSSYDKGGAGVFIQIGAEFNMYGGNILGCSCSTSGHYGGGVYNYDGTFNMYNGVIAYNSSSSSAGGVFVLTGSTMNMYGGEIAYNYAPTAGAGVYSGGIFTMSGDASIHDNYGSYTGSGFYNAGGGTLIMEDDSQIYDNISGDGGGSGVYMPSYNSILKMYDNSSITGNISTGIAPGVYFVSGAMSISDDVEVSGNYVVDSVTIGDLTDGAGDTVTTRDKIALKTVSDVGEKVVDSNVYLYSGKTITFDDYDGNDVYVTAANGLGAVVATSVDDDEDKGNLASDVTSYYAVRQTDNTEVHLMLAQTLDGEEISKDYNGDIDLTDLDLFDVITNDTVYTITGGTGVGTIDGDELDSSSAGTFIIEAYTPACNTNPPTWQTSTLTITPKVVDIEDIETSGSVVGTTVELDNTSGSIDGDVNGDDVYIDFSVAYGEIDDTDYDDGTTGKFDVSIYDISLAGDDAGNYTLGTVNDGDGTTVTINATIPHVSWPTATDLVYGDSRSDGDLIGGTVVVQTGNATDGYEYTTVEGKFEWVSDEVYDAGTHTYEVEFVVSGDYDEDITEALAGLTHNVTQVVQAAEVTFTITDSIIDDIKELAVTATYYDTDSEETKKITDYVLWYCNAEGGSWSTDEPTEAGSYLLGAALTSDNYHHAGTQESTAKQIGAFVIGSVSADDLYDVTFEIDGNLDNDLAIDDALAQSIHILPSVEGYSAWTTSSSGSAVVYEFGSRFAQPAYNVDFIAVPAVDNATLSGTVTGTNLDGTTGNLSGVVVTLMQGAEQIAVTTTNSAGYYEFTVPEGRYNVVVTRDQVIRNEITLYVNLDDDTDEVDVLIPDIRQNTVFNVASGMTAITVDGMDDLIVGINTAVSYKVELNPSSDTAAILAKAAEADLTADNAKFYIDLSIQKREADASAYEEIDLTDDDLLTFYIPLAGIYQGYDHYSVYFDDGSGNVEILTSVTDFTVTTAGDLLTLKVQDSGVYGLVFWDEPTTPTAGNDITDAVYSSTPISTDDMFTGVTSDGTRTYFITSEDGEATIDADGNVTVTKVGTFTVTVKVAATAGHDACSSTATLEVEPKTITISAITCDDKEADGDTDVDLNTTSGVLVGVVDGDSVSIDFDGASGAIANDTYTSSTTLEETGEEIFAVTASGFALTGTDADNYTLAEDTSVSSQVTVTMSLVYIAWPAAHDIIYGQEKTDENLYGGKVVVYDSTKETYTDITDDGKFQWVANTSADDWTDFKDDEDTTIKVGAGTYAYDVQFVADEDISGSYSTALENATQMVTQVVQAAEVTFTIGDSTLEYGTQLSISVKDEFDNELDSDDYEYLYSVNGEWVDTEPTDAGSYLIGASLTSNYRHAGTQESNAKQIGAFTIGVTNPATYSVTFEGYAGENYDITDALPETIHILPTLDENYTGWLHEDGTTYDFGERFTQPAENVTFTAIEAPIKSATISGTVTGTDLNGIVGKISRVGVAIYQGSTLVDYTTTSADTETLGEFSFDVVPGMYNLVITYDLDITTEITYFVDCTTTNYNETILLPDVIQNIVMEVATGLPDMVVNGLSDLLTSDKDSEVLLEITANTTEDEDIVAEIVATAADHGISADEIKEFFNIDISSRTDEEPSLTAVTETDKLLTFYIPLTGMYQGHDEYTVYRYHEGEVQTIKEEENDDGEYIEVSGSNLIIHVNKFSLYGIAFANESSDTTSSTGSGTTYYYPKVADSDNGTVDLSHSRASKNTEVTITTVPDDGYQVDTVTVTDSYGDSYTVTDNGDGTYTFTQPSIKVTVSVTFAAIEEEVTEESELPFTDVSVDDWFYEDVLYLYNLGMITGTTDTTFSPYVGNSRAMVAQMMYNLEGKPDNTQIDFFPDVVVGQWYEPAINWCAANGVVDGYTDGLYRPDNIISKQEFANVLYDHCLHLGYDVSALDDLSTFADAPSVWAMTYVMWAVEAELVQGDNNGYLNCGDQLSRCEATAMFARFLRNVYES